MVPIEIDTGIDREPVLDSTQCFAITTIFLRNLAVQSGAMTMPRYPQIIS